MAPKLLLPPAVSVLLVPCLDGRSDAPAVHCADPNRADCIVVAEGTLWGPGAFGLPRPGLSPLPVALRLRQAGGPTGACAQADRWQMTVM